MEKGAQAEPPPQAAELWNSRLQKSTRGGSVYECIGAYQAAFFLSLRRRFFEFVLRLTTFANSFLTVRTDQPSFVLSEIQRRHLQSKAHQVVIKNRVRGGEEFLGGKGCYWRILICT